VGKTTSPGHCVDFSKPAFLVLSARQGKAVRKSWDVSKKLIL